MNHSICEHANTKNIRAISSKALPFPMLRYRSIAQYYIEQPGCIFVEKKEKEKRYSFNKVFHIMIESESKLLSWGVYENDDEERLGEIGDLLLRKSEWNKEADMQYCKENRESERALLKRMPNLKGESAILTLEKCLALHDILTKYDTVIFEAGKPQKRTSPLTNEWSCLGFIRVLDGWTITLDWGNSFECKPLEEFYEKYADEFEALLSGEYEDVHRMALDYYVPLEDFVRYVYDGVDSEL